MAETAAAPENRSLVPHLRLGATRDEDYLFGNECTNCGNRYAGPRLFCGKCSSSGPFKEFRIGRDAEVYVWTIIHQATPYVKAPYIAAIVDLPEGVSINTNIEADPKPESVQFGQKLKMYTEKVSEDREGNSYIAYRYRPA